MQEDNEPYSKDDFLGSERQRRDFPWYPEFKEIWNKRMADGRTAKARGEQYVDPRQAEFVHKADIWRLLQDYLEDPGLRSMIDDTVGIEYPRIEGHVLWAYAYWFSKKLPYFPLAFSGCDGAFSGTARTAAGIVSGYYTGLDDQN